MATASQTHRLSWIDIFQHESELDDLPKHKDLVRLKEHTTGAKVTRDTPAFRQFYG
jgi:hypothetical protein